MNTHCMSSTEQGCIIGMYILGWSNKSIAKILEHSSSNTSTSFVGGKDHPSPNHPNLLGTQNHFWIVTSRHWSVNLDKTGNFLYLRLSTGYQAKPAKQWSVQKWKKRFCFTPVFKRWKPYSNHTTFSNSLSLLEYVKIKTKMTGRRLFGPMNPHLILASTAEGYTCGEKWIISTINTFWLHALAVERPFSWSGDLSQRK